jgi:hypothetical protein
MQTAELERLREETQATSQQVMEARQQADALSTHLAWSSNQALEKSVRFVSRFVAARVSSPRQSWYAAGTAHNSTPHIGPRQAWTL